MPSTLLERASERLPRRYSKHANDVFVLVKAYVSDNELCQEPLLILPGDLHEEIANAFSTMANTNATCILIWMSLSPSPSLLIKPWTHHYRLFATWGMDTSLSDERRQDLKDLAQYLLDFFPQLARGAHYLQQLSGELAVRRQPLTKLEYILAGSAPPLQRGQPNLIDPEPYNVRRLQVKFHRYYWL